MKNFFDYNDEKLTDKAFTHNLIISVVSIVLCLIVLCSATYAWFVSETTSTGNTLISGSFDIEVSVINTADASMVTVTEEQDGTWSCTLLPGSYTVTLNRVTGSTSNGYCYVTVGANGTAQPSDMILDSATEGEPDFTFTITVTEDTPIKLEPMWGIHASPLIVNNGSAPMDETVETNP